MEVGGDQNLRLEDGGVWPGMAVEVSGPVDDDPRCGVDLDLLGARSDRPMSWFPRTTSTFAVRERDFRNAGTSLFS